MKSFFAPLTRCHIILLLALIDCIMKNGAVLDGVHNIGLMFLKRKQLMALHICGVFYAHFHVEVYSFFGSVALICDLACLPTFQGLNLFTYQPSIAGTWWIKGGALRYRYINSTVQEGETIFIDFSPKGDSVQTLFEYGVFASEGSKFFSPLPELNSRMRRRLADMLKLKKRVKYSDKFTFKAAGLPSFRVQALSDKDVDKLVRVGSNEKKLSELKKVFNSPSLHIQSNSFYSCKDEVVALNLLSLHLRDELSGKSTGMPEDEEILTQDIPERQRTAVEFRLKFKRLVTNYLDITSARAIETKRECLSRKRDEL